MRENLSKAFATTIGLEGNYIDDPDDSGGETKYGITKKYHPEIDIKNLTVEQAMDIYYAEYWNPCKCDELPYPLDCIVFDTAINMGAGTAKGFLNKCNGDAATYLELRRSRYDDIVFRNPRQKKFLKGWYNRIARLKEIYNVEVERCRNSGNGRTI